jgi:cell division protein FtsB
MAGFDQKCPHCDHEIDCQGKWQNTDYSASFSANCDWCKRAVQVFVGMEPIFETGKVTCAMCAKADVDGNGCYCDSCHQRIKNKGDDMTDMTEAEITGHRIIFEDVVLYLKNGIHVDLRATSDNAASIIWASERIDELEMAKKKGEEMAETIDELEAEIKRLTDQSSSKSTNPESDEELHQRRRRERMLDEVTLICVRDGIERMNCDPNAEHSWGRRSRDSAENICDGINDFDAK